MTDVPTGQLVGVALSLVGSAFFSSSETALTGLGMARAEQIVDRDAPNADALKLWVKEPNAILTTILIGNNIANVTASALATSVAEWALRDVNSTFISPIAVAVGVTTLLLLSFGEITPKTMARTHRERLAVPYMKILRVFHTLFMPATLFFVMMTRWVAQITGSELDKNEPRVREEDIEYLVELGGREGSISEERRDLLESVFEFADTVTREVMVPRTDVSAISVDTGLDDLMRLILQAGHSRMPVYEGDIDEIVGIVHIKDLFGVLRNGGDRDAFDVSAILRDAHFVPETKPIDQLMAEMQEMRSHMAIVVDEFGGVEGIVTLEDIIEELFGEIWDEHDRETEAAVQKLGPMSWVLDARIDLEDVGELFDVEIADDDENDYDTLGGFIAKQTGSVSTVGTQLDAWGIRFTVADSDRKRIRRVRAEWVGDDKHADEERVADEA